MFTYEYLHRSFINSINKLTFQLIYLMRTLKKNSQLV